MYFILWIATYPLDKVIWPLNNWDLDDSHITFLYLNLAEKDTCT